jgi:RNA recognition motif-containing protein
VKDKKPTTTITEMVITVATEAEVAEVEEEETEVETEEEEDTEVEEVDSTVDKVETPTLPQSSSMLTIKIVSRPDQNFFSNSIYYLDNDEDLVAVKIRGLDYGVTYNEIKSFFNGFNYVDNSVILGKGRDGRNNGFGSILMKTAEDVDRAVAELNKKYIGERYVDLSVIAYTDYRSFNSEKYTQSKNNRTCKLFQEVNSDNEERSLVLRGLPYSATKDSVLDFVKDFGTCKESDIFIEEFNGKKTGSCLVVFENP